MEEPPASTPGPHDRPRPDGADIRKVTDREVDAVARVLAQAFDDDPVFGWIQPDSGRRPGMLERGFALFMRRIYMQHEHCYVHAGHAGAALWLPPGTWHLGPFAQLRMTPGTVRAIRGGTPRLMRLLLKMEAEHPRDPHYYLPIIGVAPSWQGRGFGSALLRPVLEICDRESVPAYLEASSPRNRELYERHGFQVTGELRVKDSPPLWPMWREPQLAAAA